MSRDTLTFEEVLDLVNRPPSLARTLDYITRRDAGRSGPSRNSRRRNWPITSRRWNVSASPAATGGPNGREPATGIPVARSGYAPSVRPW